MFKDTGASSCASIVNFEYNLQFILLLLLLNSNKYSKTLASDNKFPFNIYEKKIAQAAGKILLGCMFSYFSTQHQVPKRIHFHNNASKKSQVLH